MHVFSLLMMIVLLLTSCSRDGSIIAVNEVDEPSYRRGKQELRANKNDEALNAFLKVIEKRNHESLDSPESHFEVGRLYLEYMKDPIYSIYHLREYLRLMPESPYAANVKDMINSAQKEFAKTLPGRPYNDAIDRLDLMDLLKQVRAENLELKQKLATAKQQVDVGVKSSIKSPAKGQGNQVDPAIYSPPSQIQIFASEQSKGAEESQTNAPAQKGKPPSSYTVKAGDSLYNISTKVYGTGKHWKKIFEYNKDVLPVATALQPGMVLKIPENPGN
jgi:LysM repeat protein